VWAPNTFTGDFEIEVATGGAGAEAPIGVLKGWANRILDGAGEQAVMALPIPIDALTVGTRVSYRLRKSGTSTTAWNAAFTSIVKPITGVLLSTTNLSKCLPAAAAPTSTTSGGSAWASGSYVQMTATAAAALVVFGVLAQGTTYWEFDLATGGAGAETVITTVSGDETAHAAGYVPLPNPLDNIASSARVAVRSRGNNASQTQRFALNYFEKPLL
jgi:hypothetical protein